MSKEHQLQNDASNDFARTTSSDVAPQNTEQVSSARTQEGGQYHEQQADVMATTDVEPTQRTQARTHQESPFLNILMERGKAVIVAKELLQENQQLAVKAEKYDRQLQQSKDSYNRQKEADYEGLKEKQRIRKARQRDREKQEAKTQEVQKSQDNPS
jgi:hypothetical protein